MARPPRIWYPGALYHIIARGNNRESIFLAPEDYQTYLNLLQAAKLKYGFKLHAYALMANHVHLMLETGEQPPGGIMQFVHTAYTVWLNKKYARVGHVLQGRYKSVLVERESYAMELGRYIHLNPVRAKICARPEEYVWSSYRVYMSCDAGRKGLVDTDLILSLCHAAGSNHSKELATFTLQGLHASRELSYEVTAGQFLGSAAFIKHVRGQTPV